MRETPTRSLNEFGQSLWYDNISRSVIRDGTLARLIDEDGLMGVTSNPTIFMKAITEGSDYDGDIARLTKDGKSPEEITRILMIGDIREAAKVLEPVYKKTGGLDGYVSLEVRPDLAYDAQGTVDEAEELFREVERPNVMIKVPGTAEGAAAVRELLKKGVNINVTLLFSPEHYRRVALAYQEALEERLGAAQDITGLHSVASFFLSRIDKVVDSRLDGLAAERPAEYADLKKLRGQTAVAVAKVTYGIFQQLFFSRRFQKLAGAGGNIQRPLWASTSTKDPAYSDVKYVEALIGPHTVNTLPQNTIDAFRDHGKAGETITVGMEEAERILQEVEARGIDLGQVYADLQTDGVEAFADSYRSLIESVLSKAGE